jgi:hypothetical protein
MIKDVIIPFAPPSHREARMFHMFHTSPKPTSGQRRCESARGHNFRLARNPGSVSPMGTTSGDSVPTVQEL